MGVSELTKSINAAADLPGNLKDQERSSLLAACERLKGKLEDPRESLLRILFALFDALSVDGGEFELDQLTSRMDADPLLVARITRFLAGMGFFEEVGQGIFKSTQLSASYVSGSPLTQAVIHLTSQNEVISALPSYFEENGYKNRSDAYDGPFQYARCTNLHYFDWLATNPRLQQAFNVVMGLPRTTQKQRWFDFFPVESKLRVESPSDPLLVDIGGGVGHDLVAFKQQHPTLPGKLIVQDIPVVIESIKELPGGIEAMKHDFFSPQPVKGAKAYYLAHILHDWPDKQALVILGNIREVMSLESILFIYKTLIPDSKVPLQTASVDLIMMANFSSLERTKKQFEELLTEAGFDLVGAWTPQNVVPGSGTLLEAVSKL